VIFAINRSADDRDARAGGGATRSGRRELLEEAAEREALRDAALEAAPVGDEGHDPFRRA